MLKKDLEKECILKMRCVDNNKVEQRRLLWTRYDNINKWLDTLKSFFVEKCFAQLVVDEEDDNVIGELVFFQSQLHRILNLDESEVSTDGTTKETGGRPSTKLASTNPAIPIGATATNKSGKGSTFIGGSTASGWPIPPHFQMISKAKDENKKVSLAFFQKVKHVEGWYEFGHLHECGITVNSNEKGGMDEEQFEKYIFASIVPLYEDACDKPGHRVAILVDSGPGRNNLLMLARLRARGFYLLPGPPNTTAVTQATDQNYGEFKRVYWSNLKKLSEYRLERSETIKPTDIPLLVFGATVGTGDDAIVLFDSYEIAFGFERNKEVWNTIGISPFNRNCLRDAMVKHEVVILPDGRIDEDAYPCTKELLQLERSNREAIIVLNENGFEGRHLSKDAPKLDQRTHPVNVTVAGTRERQDLLAAATTHGAKFLATYGDALNSDDVFMKEERKVRTARILVLEKKKTRHDHCTKIAQEANEIIQQCLTVRQLDLYIDDDAAEELTNPQLKILYEFKMGRKPKAGEDSNKEPMVVAWNFNKMNDPLNFIQWTERENEELD